MAAQRETGNGGLWRRAGGRATACGSKCGHGCRARACVPQVPARHSLHYSSSIGGRRQGRALGGQVLPLSRLALILILPRLGSLASGSRCQLPAAAASWWWLLMLLLLRTHSRPCPSLPCLQSACVAGKNVGTLYPRPHQQHTPTTTNTPIASPPPVSPPPPGLLLQLWLCCVSGPQHHGHCVRGPQRPARGGQDAHCAPRQRGQGRGGTGQGGVVWCVAPMGSGGRQSVPFMLLGGGLIPWATGQRTRPVLTLRRAARRGAGVPPQAACHVRDMAAGSSCMSKRACGGLCARPAQLCYAQ